MVNTVAMYPGPRMAVRIDKFNETSFKVAYEYSRSEGTWRYASMRDGRDIFHTLKHARQFAYRFSRVNNRRQPSVYDPE